MNVSTEACVIYCIIKHKWRHTFCIRFTIHFLGKNACGRKAFLRTASNKVYFHFMNFYFQDLSFVFIVVFILRDLRYIYILGFFFGVDILWIFVKNCWGIFKFRSLFVQIKSIDFEVSLVSSLCGRVILTMPA